MLNLHLLRSVGAWLSRVTQLARARDGAAPPDSALRWPPSPALVLASSERHAHEGLRDALALEHPKGFLLSHVPLHKLVRVPPKHPYREWLMRTARLTVDFALLDQHGYARAVVLMPVARDQPRQVRRRGRLLRMLRATRMPMMVWERDCQSADAEQLRRRLFRKDLPLTNRYYITTPGELTPTAPAQTLVR